MSEEQPIISVIIPVYNSEKTISRCVDSIIDQTYTDLEIILVNDGSSDKSGEICDRYALRDKRVKVIHKSNDGVSSARNCGLDVCSGDYISFIDSDDYIEKTMYDELLLRMNQENTSISLCAYYYISSDKKDIVSYENGVTSTTSEQLLLDIFNYRHMGALWNKLFKKDLFSRNGTQIRFNEDINFCEDVLILTRLVETNGKIAVSTKPMYNYVVYANSLCHGKIDERRLSITKALDLIVEQCSNKFPSIVNSARYFLVTNKIKVLLDLYENKTQNQQHIVSVKKQLKSQYKKCALKIRLRILLAVNCPMLYKRMKKH